MSQSYAEFLASKFYFSQACGFEVAPDELSPILKPHQKDLVRWAVRKGRCAIFAAFGLGKTLMQMEIQRLLYQSVGGIHLIIAPLGVRQEFLGDASKLGMQYRFIRSAEEIDDQSSFYITNYESVRDGKLDVHLFTSVSLDEASVLRSYGSKTYQEFLTLFADVRYKFVATATPSPNRHKELIHYAGFLGIMDTGQALTRFFQRDSTQANNLTLYPHMEREFYLWLHSWAIFIQRPSDLGYSDEGYDLPPFTVHYHEVSPRKLGGKVDRDGQIQLVNDAALGLKDAAEEKRESIPERVAKACEILSADPESHYILWHDLEAERRAIEDDVLAELFINKMKSYEEQVKHAYSDATTPGFFHAKPVPVSEPLVDTQQCADYFRISPSHVRKLVKANKIPHHWFSLGGRQLVRFRISEVERATERGTA